MCRSHKHAFSPHHTDHPTLYIALQSEIPSTTRHVLRHLRIGCNVTLHLLHKSETSCLQILCSMLDKTVLKLIREKFPFYV